MGDFWERETVSGQEHRPAGELPDDGISAKEKNKDGYGNLAQL